MVTPGSVEVVVATYNNPRALHLALCGLQLQTMQAFAICIADDGSTDETRALVQRWAAPLGPRLRHVWQEDDGFRKNRILNRAIASSSAEYLIFLDGDCVPGRRFVERHLALRQPRRFCTGGMVRLGVATSERLTPELVQSGEAFSAGWLRAHGALGSLSRRLKAGLHRPALSDLLERLTPVSRTWNGGNSSTWREELLRVNGFDERFGYGAEDIELGFRLNNAGVHGRHLRYSAPVLHLEHEREYADPAIKARNKALALQHKRSGLTVSPHGIARL